MASRPITISEYGKGLQTQPDATALPLGAAQVAQNVVLDDGTLKARDGRTVSISTPANTTTNCRAIAELYIPSHTPSSRFFCAIGTKIYWQVNKSTARQWGTAQTIAVGQFRRALTNTPTGATNYIYECTAVSDGATSTTSATTEPTWPLVAGTTVVDNEVTWTCRANAEYWDEISTAQAVNASNDITLTQMNDSLILTDGAAYVRMIDANGTFTTLTEFPPPTTAPTITPTTADLTLDRCDRTTAMDTNYTGQGGYKDGTWKAGSPNQNAWHTFCNPNNPDTSDVDAMYAYAQTAVIYGEDGVTRDSAMSFYVSAAGGYAGQLDAGDAYCMRKHTARTKSTISDTGFFDLSTAGIVKFSMYVEADAMLGTTGGGKLYLVLGESDTVSSWQKVEVTADVSGTLLASLAVKTWRDFAVDISGLTDSAINAVQWIGFYFENLDIVPETDPADTENDYIRITFSPITANMSTAAFTQDDYEFTYTLFDTGASEESAEYVDPKNLSTPYPTLAINYDIPTAIQVTCTRPIGSTAEQAYVYARGGVSKGQLRKIGECNFSGDNTAARTATMTAPWDGSYEASAAYLPEYLGKPPIGATNCCIYRNRAIYVGHLPRMTWTAATEKLVGDDVIPLTVNGKVYYCTTAGTTGTAEPTWGTTLGGTTADGTVTWTCQAQDAADVVYYSNYGDPTRVPQAISSLSQVPVTYGGWTDTERSGGPITGLIGAGPVLVALKKEKIFLAKGDPGVTGDSPDAFFLTKLKSTEGCLSPKSVCMVENRVVWQGRNKIMALIDDAEEVSEVIRPTVSGYTATQQAAAWSVYDTANRRMMMFYPSGSYGTSPNSEALVLSLQTGGWSQWTAQPGACGFYTPYATSPGVYLADGYGTGGLGKVFLLSSSATTDAINSGTAAAITATWVSGYLQPNPGLYVMLQRLYGALAAANTTGPFTLDVRLWLNGDDSRPFPTSAAKSLTVTNLRDRGNHASQGYGQVMWTPARHGEVDGFAVSLSFTAANIPAVLEMVLEIEPRSPLRGRTVARA